MDRLCYVVVVIFCLFTTGCSAVQPVLPSATPLTTGSYQTLTIDEFAALLDQPDSYTVVNVHIPYEGEVPNTDLRIAYNDVEALTVALPDRNAPIILYCRSGRMSEEATQTLLALGYTNILDVPGGMNSWTASGRDLLLVEDGS